MKGIIRDCGFEGEFRGGGEGEVGEGVDLGRNFDLVWSLGGEEGGDFGVGGEVGG